MFKGVLFVCLGNICRSPTAEAVFRSKATAAGIIEQLLIDSCGTGGYHSGESPDPRAQQAGKLQGYDLSSIKARKVVMSDFEKFDVILAMDKQNYSNLIAMSDRQYHHKIKLFLDYAEGCAEKEVPDPYYGGDDGFGHVIDLIEQASKGLIADIINKAQAK